MVGNVFYKLLEKRMKWSFINYIFKLLNSAHMAH